MVAEPHPELVTLDTEKSIWNRIFTVAPLVVIGTREPDGRANLAPKHMAFPLGWNNYFGFVCTPSHSTYQNIVRTESFTVSFPKPEQVLLASLAASPRCEDDSKPALEVLPTFLASKVEAEFLVDSYLFLECRLVKLIDGFDQNSLVTGKVVAAYTTPDTLRGIDIDDRELIEKSPLLAYLSPGRFCRIGESYSFPFPQGFQRGDE